MDFFDKIIIIINVETTRKRKQRVSSMVERTLNDTTEA